jgi:hypothetical protein
MLVKGWWSWIPGSGGLHHEWQNRKSKVKSTFGRQKIVETGLVRNVGSSVSLSASDGRVWIGSSVKSYFRMVGRVSVVAFERGSVFEGICDSRFSRSELESIVVPSSVVVLGKRSFSECDSFEWVAFERGSGLERIEESAFRGSGLKAIAIPSSVVVLGKYSFLSCRSLESVTFESGSRLERINEEAFSGSRLRSIEIPSSVVVLGKCSFFSCKSLESVTFERGSRLERIEESAFSGDLFTSNQLKSILIPSSVVVLGKQSFYLCKSLQSIIFESSSRLERIEESAFAGDRVTSNQLRSILIPSSVVVLGKQSFYLCESLESVEFESGSRLELIEYDMFENTRVNFPLLSQELARSKKK